MAKETPAQRKARLHAAAMKRRAAARGGSSADDRGVGGVGDIEVASSDRYIGVPSDYKANVTTGRQAVTSTQANYGSTFISSKPEVKTVAPRYKEGAQYDPAGWSRERIAELQMQMVKAGLLTGQFALGRWDDASSDAYKSVLSYANRAGLRMQEALDAIKANPTPDDAGPKRAPLVVQLSNEADLRTIADKVATDAIGHGFTPAELAQYILQQHGAERAEQTAAYNATETGGTVTAAPNAQVAATDLARELHPQEFEATGLVNLAKSFLDGIRPVDRTF